MIGVVFGQSANTPVYGCMNFDLTFLNEVTNRHETIFAINVKIIDSCIDIIVSRSVIQEYHLVHKIFIILTKWPALDPI